MPAPRSLFGRLLLLFTLVPIVELALLVWLGGRIGFWPTVGLIALTALVGTWLAQREGLSAWARFQGRLTSGGLPGRELTDGLIILVSAAFLLTPGVLTDLVGFLGLLPPTRAIIREVIERKVRRSAFGAVHTAGFGGGSNAAPPPRRCGGGVVDAVFEDVPPEPGGAQDLSAGR